jgi:hypothetical protein
LKYKITMDVPNSYRIVARLLREQKMLKEKKARRNVILIMYFRNISLFISFFSNILNVKFFGTSAGE